GGLALLRSRLADGSAPAAPCGSNGISALWKRAKGAGAPARRAQIRFQLFASFQLTAPPHGVTASRADRRITHTERTTTMTHPNDPGANTDHDPSSGTESHTDTGAIHTTTQTLALARADIHTAVGVHHDPHRPTSTHGRHCPTPCGITVVNVAAAVGELVRSTSGAWTVP